MRAIVPIRELNRRIPEAGRIRIGVKTKNAMKAIDTFRFTSQDREAVEQIAKVYGGEVKPWSDPKASPGQFEVITQANEIAVVLPPEPLGGTPIYEQWSGGGCQRRCDGLTCTVIQQGPDGAEPVEVPCMCAANETMACEPHTRLSVVLPDVRFTGVWRLDSKSWNVAQEMPGFVDMIQALQERGLVRAVLRLEHRTTVSLGQTKRFVVPVLGVSESMDAIAAGAASVGSLGAGNGSSVPALGEGSPSDDAPIQEGEFGTEAPSVGSDDDIVDAEVVYDDRSLASVVPASISDSRALVAARRVYKRHDEEQPTALEQVTDARRIAEVLDELELLGSTP